MTNETMDLFVPCYSISLLYQKENSITMRVFISNAKNKKDALLEATSLYSWTMQRYKLVQSVAAKVEPMLIGTLNN